MRFGRRQAGSHGTSAAERSWKTGAECVRNERARDGFSAKRSKALPCLPAAVPVAARFTVPRRTTEAQRSFAARLRKGRGR